ncbi:hypothetical protein EDC39_11483 [Geothermobacter ehrlichii]|uniref:Uncharacterized protein n=1 Tax=Geothermobacter ehrlichii TaxID=213224 RepID=A0A5D3WJZ3_9BACT|nr:hypothetical protein [Geothermobacter ehrlichii]TYO96377.1 hypothetical protein EDC39_11483 [Geothermobacter ehrlichii]
MSISARYRELVAETENLQRRLSREQDEGLVRFANRLSRAVVTLAELREGVGEIPQMHLERELTPVLLRAHNQIDRVRVELEEQAADWAGRLWNLQQTIYRLLNDL